MEKEWTEAADLSPPPSLVQIYYPPCCSICQNETGVAPVFFFFLFFLGSKSIRGLSKILAINISTYSMCSTTCKWKIEGGEGGRSREERERAVLILLRQIESWTLHPCRACQSPSSPSSLSSSRERKGGRSRGEGGGRNGS